MWAHHLWKLHGLDGSALSIWIFNVMSLQHVLKISSIAT